jgi:hypothetical protein
VPTRIAGDNGANAASTAFVATAIANARTSSLGGAVLRSYLAGLGMSNDGSAPNTKIKMANGVCADDSGALMIAFSSTDPNAWSIDCTTVGVGGLDAGALDNNKWYHAFAIAKPDGTKGLLASLSTTPALPSGYTLKRRTGSFKTDSNAHIVPFSQNGDEFLWITPASVVNDTGVVFPTSRTNLTMVVPTGVVVNAIFSSRFGSASPQAITFSALAQTGATVAVYSNAASHSLGSSSYMVLRTDTASRIQWLADGAGSSTTRIIFTHGWIDRRGRDD